MPVDFPASHFEERGLTELATAANDIDAALIRNLVDFGFATDKHFGRQGDFRRGNVRLIAGERHNNRHERIGNSFGAELFRAVFEQVHNRNPVDDRENFRQAFVDFDFLGETTARRQIECPIEENNRMLAVAEFLELADKIFFVVTPEKTHHAKTADFRVRAECGYRVVVFRLRGD